MWAWIIGFVVIVGVIVVVMNRRGSIGASRPDDLSPTYHADEHKHTGGMGGGGSGGFGGDGGGGF